MMVLSLDRSYKRQVMTEEGFQGLIVNMMDNKETPVKAIRLSYYKLRYLNNKTFNKGEIHPKLSISQEHQKVYMRRQRWSHNRNKLQAIH